jgi:hypothetical protein
MTLSVHFSTRDFSSPILMGLNAEPLRLDWTAHGGPERAEIRLTGDEGKLIEGTRLLRCPVIINDPIGTPVWWGYVEEVVILIGAVQFSVSLEGLFNRVRVRYGFISPDNRSGDVSITERTDNIPSQRDFGLKEITLHQDGIDDDFAESLRDRFLEVAALPGSTLSQWSKPGKSYAFVRCAGWFKTLSWQPYENLEGFYANTGPGVGTFTFDQSASYCFPSQVFTPGAAGRLKYAYFQIRAVGSPTGDLHAQLRDGMGTVLATSEAVSGSGLSNITYRWARFTFATPFDVVGGTSFMIGVTGGTTDPANHFAIRTDENQGYQNGYGQYFNGTSWINLPSVTNPGGAPDLLFRALCITDTGTQISTIASSGNQFFTLISAPASGILTCPYRENGFDCLKEIQNLMALGTINHRKILARVSPERQLEFYEQPDPESPSIYMDRQGHFYTHQGIVLKPYFPPIGQFASYSGSSRIMMPFDKYRTPACFIERAAYLPKTGRVVINTSS